MYMPVFRLLVTIAAMAIPSVPSASIMTTIMILTSMNIPVEDIALLLAIEWYLYVYFDTRVNTST